MSTLGQVNAAWAGDAGDPDPLVRRALAAADGLDGYLTAVAALCGARLLMPIIATGDEGGATPDPSRHAEMAAVLITGPDGRQGLLAFTGLDSLQAFDARARPVLATLDEVAGAAADAGAEAVVVDVAGPHVLAIEPPLLSQLAVGQRLIRTDAGWAWLAVKGTDSPPGEPSG